MTSHMVDTSLDFLHDECAQTSPKHICTETSRRHNHFQSRLWPHHFSERDSEFDPHDCIRTYTSLWRMESHLAKRWWWLERMWQMTWMRKSTATMVPRDMRLKKLQPVIDGQSPMRIKQDSLTFPVKRKLQEYYVLLNHPQTLRGDAVKYTVDMNMESASLICTYLRSRGQPKWSSKSSMGLNRPCQWRCWWQTATEWSSEAKSRRW